MKSNHFFIIIVALNLIECAAPQGYLSPNFNQSSATHKEIAILPFDVSISSPRRISEKENRNSKMNEQEKQGSLDMQRDLFLDVAKQVQKGKIIMRFQDYNRTNKILSENGVRLDQISQMDKSKLATMLGVDAVLWGETIVNVSGNRMGPPNYRDGVEAEVSLFDARTGERLWSGNSSQRPSSQMDTPHRLASNTLNAIARQIPYRIEKKKRG